MKIETLNERIQKAAERIEKKRATIVKKSALVEKKTAEMEKTADSREKRFIECDIRWLEEDIKRLGREIAETEKTLEKYRKQLAGEIERESLWVHEIPETMIRMKDELVERWDGYDIEHRNFIRKCYTEMEYEEFSRKFKRAGFDFMAKTDDQIHEENVRNAESAVLGLYNRVKEVTGEVTDWSGIRAAGGALNGTVIGKQGRCEVETIGAGGYNIQRYHLRVLVKALN